MNKVFERRNKLKIIVAEQEQEFNALLGFFGKQNNLA